MTQDIYTKSSEKRPYKSIFSSGYITASNYIVELIFQKRFENLSKENGPRNFWNTEKYGKSYKGQIVAAHRLLKKYKDISIIKALKSPKSKNIYALNNKKLIPIIEEFEKDMSEKTFTNTSNDSTQKKSMKPFRKSKNKLEGL